MIEHEAQGYGNNKIRLKEEIGELVRRVFHNSNNPARFYNLSYRIIRNREPENNGKGKWKIIVFVYEMEIRDSKIPFIWFRCWLNRWKFRKAVEHNYLNILDRIRLYGLFPEAVKRKLRKNDAINTTQ